MSELIEQPNAEISDPRENIGNALQMANALMEYIDASNQPPMIIKGKKHLLVEHWLFLGAADGVTPVTVSCEPYEFKGATGFRAEVRLERDGHTVGQGIAICMDDEANWKYSPHYSLMSMAQTRAESKALSMKYRWIPKMAGAEWSTTPAEEMMGVVFDDDDIEADFSTEQDAGATSNLHPRSQPLLRWRILRCRRLFVTLQQRLNRRKKW
jgi:hypothetical protein